LLERARKRSVRTDNLEQENIKMKAIGLKSNRIRVFTCAVVATLLLSGCLHCPEEVKMGRHNARSSGSKIKLIYDGDIGPDPCDFSTISMLHEYHNKGMIELVGVIGATPDPYLASTFSIYNQIYGNDIPIGSFNNAPGGVDFSDEVRKMYYDGISRWCHADQNKAIYEKFGNGETKRADDVPNPVELYRKLLSEASDNSITIYAAGQLFNFPALFASGADQYSPLSGEELLRTKLKEFVFMGGYFPVSSEFPPYRASHGAEYNWWALGNRETTRTTINTLVKMEKPITYVGFEVGVRIRVGKEMARRLGRDHPTTESFYLYRATARIPRDAKEKGPQLKSNNPAFDELALFYAVEGGVGEYFGKVQGRVEIDENGANTWVSGDGNESYITLLPGVEKRLRETITDRITGHF
jgi:inosine-uridine nucleoside N-ribohydrolase